MLYAPLEAAVAVCLASPTLMCRGGTSWRIREFGRTLSWIETRTLCNPGR